MNLSSHIRRMRYHFGRRVRIGPQSYRIRGYLASNLMYDPCHEPHIAKVLQRIFSERTGTFVDVGANIGQTLLKALSIDPSTRYKPSARFIGWVKFLISRHFRSTRARVLSLFRSFDA